LAICLAIASAIVLLRSIVPLAFEQIFDSDQAVYGLMTKHLSEFRAFPLFFYGQNYMLGVESWIAVPFFWLGGPTVAMQRLPLVLLNVVIAWAYVWMFVRFGLRPRYALAASLPLIAFAPSISIDFVAALGSGIEPFGYALLLWLLRDRPIAFGALLAFGTLHREFTFLALPALAAVEIGRRPFWSVPSLARRAAGFAAVWLVVDVLKRNVNMLGPAGGDWVAGSAALGPQTFVKWLSFDVSSYAARLRDVVTWGVPDLLGLQAYTIRTYSAPSQLQAGSRLAAAAFAVALGVAIVRLLWLMTRSEAPPVRDGVRFCAYLAIIAVQNVLVYGLNGGIVIGAPAVLRYVMLVPLLPVGVLGAYFLRERSARWAGAAALAIAVWAAGNVVDNARMLQEFLRTPPPRPHRMLTEYLMGNEIRYVRGRYWDVYVVAFLSREKVIGASTETVRVSAHQAEVQRHAAEAATLQRQPCDAGRKVASWCVVRPTGQ
jgi:hypothetical protein